MYLNGRTLDARRISDGKAVWSAELDEDEAAADELVIATVTTADGEWAWRYSSLPLFEYRLRMAADGNRAFCMSGSPVIALACF